MKNSPMTCSVAAEILPWYLNGTLSSEETAALEAHLKACSRCRKEHRDTAFAAAAFNSHLTSEQLVRYAFHEVPMGPERRLLEDHLRTCPSCAEELRLVEGSRDRQHQDPAEDVPVPETGVTAPLPFRPRQETPARSWRLGAIAASLVAVLAAGYWLWSLGPASGGGPGNGGPATAGLEGPGNGFSQGRESSFQVTAAQPGTVASGPGGEVLLKLDPGASEVELVLHFPGGVPSGTLQLEVLDSVQRRVWWGGFLQAQGASELRSALPVEALPTGELALRIRRHEGGRLVTVARSRLTVEAAG